MKQILAAIDGSDASYRALDFAAKLAAGTGAHLFVLLVRQFVMGRREVLEVWNDGEVQTIVERAKDVAKTAERTGITIIEERSRDVAYTIVDVAIKQKAELLVLGASGMGNVKAFLIGSVSSEVLRKATCPVTIVQ